MIGVYVSGPKCDNDDNNDTCDQYDKYVTNTCFGHVVVFV